MCAPSHYGIIGLRMSLCAGDRDVLLAFSEEFGGKVLLKAKPKNVVYKRLIYTWSTTGRRAQAVLEKLLPRLRTKYEVADLALKMRFAVEGSRPRLSEEERSKRERIRKAIQRINSRITEPTHKDFVGVSCK